MAYQLVTCLIANQLQFGLLLHHLGFPCGSAAEESACDAGDLGSIPELGRSPGEGKGYPLQHSGLQNFRQNFMGLQTVRHDSVTFTLHHSNGLKNGTAN